MVYMVSKLVFFYIILCITILQSIQLNAVLLFISEYLKTSAIIMIIIKNSVAVKIAFENIPIASFRVQTSLQIVFCLQKQRDGFWVLGCVQEDIRIIRFSKYYMYFTIIMVTLTYYTTYHVYCRKSAILVFPHTENHANFSLNPTLAHDLVFQRSNLMNLKWQGSCDLVENQGRYFKKNKCQI